MSQNIQWTKPVCQLDSDGLYMGQTEAELDVYARNGSYIIPGGCIDVEPPEAREDHAARWTGEAWEYIPDHRGKTAYRTDNGQAVIIDTVGEISDGLTFDAPPTMWHSWNGKKWAIGKEAKAEQLAQAQAAKLAEVNRAAQACIDQAAGLDKVPQFEVATWTIQALEAKAWHADNAAATPTLDAIAGARGIPAQALKQKAYEKAVRFELLTAHVAGLRQAAEDKIYAAQTPEDVAAVQCDFCTTPPSQTTTTEVADE
ncbi:MULTISPECIES: tail fiber assembly protein [unclassified Neisseria]|uniref:tail fiber assembly protein n=1 Tax=unclassified Neisseria TaxID=2623750 RepID=UPI002665C909|nr:MULTISPECIES: tail fiber assembly protein [unclassified Neisseria]MDO1509929.1 tail fiber assembly protein [Neisseria sp. MVDL19-042950]MDO1516128.1 tail fiber assembly protein [Neisseria sp. MVDL18-041461]MDO1563243.1 tail fiber assembly protein [Neisseria sp. MVDL20-010259]